MTMPGRAIRKITGNDYSHASISLDKNLNEIYSFARFHYQNPLVGGFVKESINSLSLGKEGDVQAKIFCIPVTQKQYRGIENDLEYFKRHEERYMYNLFDLLFFKTGIQFSIRDSYICTEFVSTLLQKNGIEKNKLRERKISPEMMIKILQRYESYDGSLREYVSTLCHQDVDEDFFEKENIIFVIAKGIKQIGKLLFRKIT